MGQIARIPGNSTLTQTLLDFYASLTPELLAEEASKLENLPTSERMVASFLYCSASFFEASAHVFFWHNVKALTRARKEGE